MAVGFSPKHVQELILDNLGHEHFLATAKEAASRLGWNVSFISETGFIAYTTFSWSSWSEEVTVKVTEDTASLKSECTGSQLMDWGKNKKNIITLLAKIEEIKSLLTQEEIELKILELRESYVSPDADILNKPPSTAKDKITGFFSIFKPTEGYFITPILININLLVFFLMVASGVHVLVPQGQDLLTWGANFRPITLDGQWWRLFTACFLHIGILHLLLNMYALLYIGLIIEPYLGTTRFLAAYLISGIAASLASLWWHDFTISAGASGAIFGMYGVFLALLTTNLLDKSVKKALLTSIGVFVGYNILFGLQPDSGVDNAAHIGGVLSGLIIGYAFVPSLKQFKNKALKLSTIAALTFALIFSSFTVYRGLPNDLIEYDREMERFVSMESMALEVYSLPEETTKEDLLSELKNRGLYYWKENLALIDGLNNLSLPKPIRERNDLLKIYCKLRIQAYEAIYKAVEEETDEYEEEINEYNQKIEAIIQNLSSGR